MLVVNGFLDQRLDGIAANDIKIFSKQIIEQRILCKNRGSDVGV